MNGRTVQDSRGATFLKVGDEVAVRTGKAVLDLVGGTKLYLEPGARVRLEPRGEGAVGVQMVAGQGAFRLGGGATMMGASGARQGLVAVERTLARVYPMVTMAPVAEAGGARGPGGAGDGGSAGAGQRAGIADERGAGNDLRGYEPFPAGKRADAERCDCPGREREHSDFDIR